MEALAYIVPWVFTSVIAGVIAGYLLGRSRGKASDQELAPGRELAERIRSQTAERASRITFRGEQVSVSLSIGVTASAEGDGAESVVRRADEGLYRAKRAGRNQVQVQEAAASPAAAPVHALVQASPLHESPPQNLDTGSLCG